MATVTLENGTSFTVPDDKRLVLALEDYGVDILHRCGGYAKCTTCRVQVQHGEPQRMTQAEHDKLADGGNLGAFRLSCQMTCEQDMTVNPLMTLSNSDLDDAGPRPEDSITPDPEWTTKPE